LKVWVLAHARFSFLIGPEIRVQAGNPVLSV